MLTQLTIREEVWKKTITINVLNLFMNVLEDADSVAGVILHIVYNMYTVFITVFIIIIIVQLYECY